MKLGPIEFDQVVLASLCAKWQISRLEAFGSVLRPDFHEGSDIDLLVEFAPHAKRTLYDLFEAESEFSALLGRPVELVSKRGLANSENYIRRESILNSAVTLYAA